MVINDIIIIISIISIIVAKHYNAYSSSNSLKWQAMDWYDWSSDQCMPDYIVENKSDLCICCSVNLRDLGI